jgi:WD40 repeat protein
MGYKTMKKPKKGDKKRPHDRERLRALAAELIGSAEVRAPKESPSLERFLEDLRNVLRRLCFSPDKNGFSRGEFLSAFVTVTKNAGQLYDACLTLSPYSDMWPLVRGIELALISTERKLILFSPPMATTGWEGGVTFKDLPAGEYQVLLRQDHETLRRPSGAQADEDNVGKVWDVVGAADKLWAQPLAGALAAAGAGTGAIEQSRPYRLFELPDRRIVALLEKRASGQGVLTVQTRATELASAVVCVEFGGESGTVPLTETNPPGAFAGRIEFRATYESLEGCVPRFEVVRSAESALSLIALAADQVFLCTGRLEALSLRDVAARQTRWERADIAAWVFSLALSRDGRRILAGTREGPVHIFEAESGRELRVLRGQEGPILSVAASAAGDMAASVGRDGTVEVWDTETGQAVGKYPCGGELLTCIALSTDGGAAAAGGGNGQMQLWRTEGGREIASCRAHSGAVLCLGFSPDGRLLSSGGFDGFLRLWDVETGQSVAQGQAGAGSVMCVSFSPDGRLVAAGNSDGTVAMWESCTGRSLWTSRMHTREATGLDFESGGKILVSAGPAHEVVLWDIVAGTVLRAFPGSLD